MLTREALRNRKRRILWNNDGEDLLLPANYNSPGAEWLRGEYSGCGNMPRRLCAVDDFLGQRMKGKLEGTQVDGIFYCGYVCVPNWEFPAENTRALGPDPLKHAVDYAHANNMEFFYSFRMNDPHPMLHRGTWSWSQFNHFYDDNRNYGQPGQPARLYPEDTLHDIGDPGRLRRLDKTYWVDMLGEDAALPLRLSTECGSSTAVISFEVADDPAEAARVTLQAQWATDVDIARISLVLNGVPLTEGKSFTMKDESYNEVPWVNSGAANDNQLWYAHPVSSLQKGVNTLEVSARPSAIPPDKLLLKQVRVAIGYS